MFQFDLIYFCFCIFGRLSRYKQFKDFSKRMLVATNLFGRGMDIERVNIVFNYDMPEDSDTYLHRVSNQFPCAYSPIQKCSLSELNVYVVASPGPTELFKVTLCL